MNRLLLERSSSHVLPGFIFLALSTLVLCPGCKNDDSGESKTGPAVENSGPNGPNGGDGEMPWPPPGGTKSEVPPGVQDVMSKMLNAFNNKDSSKVAQFFVTREAFIHVSDCDPADVVDRVMDGRRQAGERAGRDGGNARLEGWKDGYIFELKKGDKPAECRAREDVGLFMARFDWTVNGKKEAGEAHFLRINGVWYFAKL